MFQEVGRVAAADRQRGADCRCVWEDCRTENHGYVREGGEGREGGVGREGGEIKSGVAVSQFVKISYYMYVHVCITNVCLQRIEAAVSGEAVATAGTLYHSG